jgi:predicted RNA-binding Zn-ribbon protein involved in translation (DUF1610 family)
MIDPETCTHAKLLPTFNEDEAKILLATCEHERFDDFEAMFGICTACTREIRKRWPRGEGQCPDCGGQVIAYASHAHYTYGDW